MPTTVVPVTSIPSSYPATPVAADSLDIPLQAADVANAQHALASEGDLLIVFNSDASLARTFTLTSVTDDKNRTGDITAYSLAAGEMTVFKIKSSGWINPANGKFLFSGSHAAIKFAIVRP